MKLLHTFNESAQHFRSRCDTTYMNSLNDVTVTHANHNKSGKKLHFFQISKRMYLKKGVHKNVFNSQVPSRMFL